MKTTIYCLSLLFLSALFLSCENPPVPEPSDIDRAKTELADVLKKAGASFTPKTDAYEDENAVITILKAKNETDTLQTTTAQLQSGLLLGAIQVKDKKSKRADSYTATLFVRDSVSYISLINLANKKALQIDLSPIDDFKFPHPICDLECCLDNFEKNQLPEYQKLADRLCKTLYPGVVCCYNGSCVSVHYVVKPRRWRCWLVANIYDLEFIAVRTLPQIVNTTAQPQPNK